MKFVNKEQKQTLTTLNLVSVRTWIVAYLKTCPQGKKLSETYKGAARVLSNNYKNTS